MVKALAMRLEFRFPRTRINDLPVITHVFTHTCIPVHVDMDMYRRAHLTQIHMKMMWLSSVFMPGES